MSYLPPLEGEWLAAYLSMPKDRFGHVVSLFYVPERDLPKQEAAWQAWCAEHEARLWPAWIHTWAIQRKAKS